jgi:hypothetical protein
MDRDVQILQIVASASLALASVIVAVVSPWFSYRNNFGWKPILRISNYTIHRKTDREVHFEFWNRQKNVVTIRHVLAEFKGVKIERVVLGSWDREGDTLVISDASQPVAASANCTFEARFGHQPIEKGAAIPLSIDVHYFDARRNKVVILTHKTKLA